VGRVEPGDGWGEGSGSFEANGLEVLGGGVLAVLEVLEAQDPGVLHLLCGWSASAFTGIDGPSTSLTNTTMLTIRATPCADRRS
jgi:hypothetical protein